MEICSIVFSEREKQSYSGEFSKLTSDQQKPLSERELIGQVALCFFKSLKLTDEDFSNVWSLVSERRSYLKLQNFMCAMRLCSAKRQGKEISLESLKTEQKVIAKRKKTTSAEPSFPKNSVSLVSKQPLKRITEEVIQEEPLVCVLEPTYVSSMWKGYYLYRIQTKVNRKIFAVQRRFSDLDWFHSQLSRIFKGRPIPPLPPKKVTGTSNYEFLEKRRLEIENYLNFLTKDTEVLNSAAFKVFTQTPLEKFSSEKKKVEQINYQEEHKTLRDSCEELLATAKNKADLFLYKKIYPFSSEIKNIETFLSYIKQPTLSLTNSLYEQIKCEFETNSVFLNLKTEYESYFINYREAIENAHLEQTKTMQELKQYYLRIASISKTIAAYKAYMSESSRLEYLLFLKNQRKSTFEDQESLAQLDLQVNDCISKIDKLKTDTKTAQSTIQKEHTELEAYRKSNLVLNLTSIVQSRLKSNEAECLYWKEALQNLKF